MTPGRLDLPAEAVLLPIDLQQGFDDPRWGNRNNPQLEANVAALLAAWRAAGRPIVHVRHHSTEPGSTLRPGQPGAEFRREAAPKLGEQVITKSVHSAFIGTSLEKALGSWKSRTLVTFGIQTNYCVATTARMAGDLGYKVIVVGDACATFGQRMLDGSTARAELAHDLALAELHGAFATVVATRDVLGSLGR